jgi:hypothetical protein
MKLTVLERAILTAILPKEGNFKTLKTVRKLREAVTLSEDEVKKWEPVLTDDKMTWKVLDDNGNPIPQEADVEISELGEELIREALEKMDKENKLKEEHFTLYEKFVK